MLQFLALFGAVSAVVVKTDDLTEVLNAGKSKSGELAAPNEGKLGSGFDCKNYSYGCHACMKNYGCSYVHGKNLCVKDGSAEYEHYKHSGSLVLHCHNTEEPTTEPTGEGVGDCAFYDGDGCAACLDRKGCVWIDDDEGDLRKNCVPEDSAAGEGHPMVVTELEDCDLRKIESASARDESLEVEMPEQHQVANKDSGKLESGFDCKNYSYGCQACMNNYRCSYVYGKNLCVLDGSEEYEKYKYSGSLVLHCHKTKEPTTEPTGEGVGDCAYYDEDGCEACLDRKGCVWIDDDDGHLRKNCVPEDSAAGQGHPGVVTEWRDC